MKRKLFVFSTIFFILLFCSITVNAEVDFDQELYNDLSKNTNPIPYIEIPDYNNKTLDNGIKIYFLENHRLPYVEIKGFIKGGILLENKKNAGITDFMTTMMNTGTKKFGEKHLDRFKELNAIDLSLSTSDNHISFKGNALTSEKDKLISLLSEMLLNPDFDADYYKRLLFERERSLQQSKTKQDNIANMYFYKNIYLDHPYSYSYNIDLLLKSIENYTVKNIKEYYNCAVRPDQTIMIIYGDFETEKMLKKIDVEFGSWKGENDYLEKPLVNINKDNFGRIILINKKDATQARIKMGYNIDIENFKERISFDLANRIFGGGDLSTRLIENLRKEKGLVYNISANYIDRQYGGHYVLNTSVKAEKAYTAIKSVKEEIKKITDGQEKITNGEIFDIINRRNAFFPENFRHKEEIMESVIYNLEFKSRENSYINKYIQGYNMLSLEDVNKYFKKYIYPEKFLTVIVGKKEDILPEFKKNNISVEVINLD